MCLKTEPLALSSLWNKSVELSILGISGENTKQMLCNISDSILLSSFS